MASTSGFDHVFHTSDLSGWEWLLLMMWPLIVFGADELRKAVVRRRSA